MFKRLSYFAGVAAIAFGPVLARAEPPRSLVELFGPLSPGQCVSMRDIRAVAAEGAVVTLTPEQFAFVRGFWAGIPPQTEGLPPGDKAFYAKDDSGDAVFGLYDDDGEVCAVFRSEGWIQRMIDAVGRGEVGKRGEKS